MISIFKEKSGEVNIDKNQFTHAAQQIELNRIQAELVTDIVRTEVKRNRQKYRYEAEIYRAKVHQGASKFGYNPPNQDGSSVVCPCCSLSIHSESIPMCYGTTNVTELEEDQKATFKLDSGVAMFFLFMKTVILYFIIKLLITDAFNLYTNYMFGEYCQNVGNAVCTHVLWNYLAIPNKQNAHNMIFIHDILNLVTILFSIIFFRYNRKYCYEVYDIIDRNVQTEDDYTIMVSKIPTLDFPKESEESVNNVEFFYRKHLELFFEDKVDQWLNNQRNWTKPKEGSIEFDYEQMKFDNGGQLRSPEIVKSISLCYNLSRLETISQTRDDMIDQFLDGDADKKHKRNSHSSQKNEYMNEQGAEEQSKSRFDTIPKRIDFLNDCEIVLNKQYANDNSVLFNMTHFVGHAFISFQYQHYRDFILMQASTDDKFLDYNGKSLEVIAASHPSQVFWTNLRVSKSSRKARTVLSFAVLFMVLVFAFAFLSAAEILKEQYAPTSVMKDKLDIVGLLKTYWAPVVATIFILAINQALSVIIKQLTIFEKHQTRSSYNISLIIKLVVYQFINTALIYFAISLAKHLYTDSDAITGPTGLVIMISWLILFSTLIELFLNLVYFPDLFQRLKVWWKYRGMRNEDLVNTFQVRLNHEFQSPQFDLAKWYSYFLLESYVICFYSYLTPVIAPIIVISMILQFWLVKLILFRRSSLYYTFDFALTRHISKMFESSVLVFAFGNFIFAAHFKDGLNYMNIAGLVIAFLFVAFISLIPEKLERRIMGQYERCEKPMYDDCVSDGKFGQTYWQQNPATCLVKQTDVTHKKSLYNPVQKVIFAEQEHFFKK